jgi:hypothetical protein
MVPRQKPLSPKEEYIMKQRLTTICIAIGLAEATLTNGDFSDGLNGWSVGGSVTATPGGVRLDDNDVIYSFLYQEAAFPAGSYTLSFDYKLQTLGAAPTGEPFAFNDLFSASLYFADSAGEMNPSANTFPNPSVSNTLLSMDSNGGNTNWRHYSQIFENSYHYVILAFELLDLNYAGSDSAVFVNNISTTNNYSVPEPSVILQLGSGMLGLFCFRKLRKKSATGNGSKQE